MLVGDGAAADWGVLLPPHHGRAAGQGLVCQAQCKPPKKGSACLQLPVGRGAGGLRRAEPSQDAPHPALHRQGIQGGRGGPCGKICPALGLCGREQWDAGELGLARAPRRSLSQRPSPS